MRLRRDALFLVVLASCGGDKGPTAECSDDSVSPFVQEGCLESLHAVCRALTTRDACESEPSSLFADGDYEITCGWSKVVEFDAADGSTCNPVAVTEACFALARVSEFPCQDPCDGDPPAIYDSLGANGARLSQVTCRDGVARDPVTAEAGKACFASDAPPLCACTEAACMAE
jgi:hypothetical protein